MIFNEFKNSRQLLLLVCCVLIILESSAQDDNWRKNIPNPVSPKAFEFLKYTETPVSTYTGIPQISIPLYTISAAGLDIPVSLSYHAGGIRVSEEAGSVGLGWTLQAGGTVVQAINGDEDSFGGGSSPFIDPFALSMPGGMQNCDSKTMLYNKQQGLIEPTWVGYGDFEYGAHTINGSQFSGYQDTKPDIFKFSVGQYSGEFMFDYDLNKFVCLNNKNIVIRSNLPQVGISRPSYFYITVPEGHTFYFQLHETTTIEETYTLTTPTNQASAGRDTRGHATSKIFQLILVLTNKGEEISFGYVTSPEITNYPTVTQTNTDNALYYPNAPGVPWHVLAGPQGGITLYPPYVMNTNYTVTKQPYAYLSIIEADQVYMEFIYSSSREDLIGGKQLDQIVVKNNTHNRDEIRRIDFNYDYFQGHSLGTNIDAELTQLEVVKTTDEKLKRLRLLSVSINNDNPYIFTYNTTQLPSKTSLAYDHLGFYNKNHNAQIGNFQTAPIDKDGTKAAVLESMQYPTGGKTLFEYEQNGTADPQPVQVPTGFEEYVGNILMSDKNTTSTPYIGTIGPAGYSPGGYAVWLNVPHDATLLIRRFLTVAGPCAAINPDSELFYPNTFWRIQHFDKAAQDMVDLQGWSAIANFVSDPAHKVKDEIGKIQVADGDTKSWEYPNSTLLLPEGIYLFTINLNDACGPQTSTGPQGEAFMQFSYVTRRALGYQTEMQYPLAPGLRVKKITALDENSATAVQREYKYFGPKLMSPILYDYTRFVQYDYVQYPGEQGWGTIYRLQVNSHTTSSVSIYSPSVSASGKFVGYDRVEEHFIDNQSAGNNGYKTFTYQNEPDEIETNNAQMPLIRNSKDNGVLLKEAIYKHGELDPVQETLYGYQVVTQPCYWSFMSFMDGRVGRPGAVFEDIYEIGFYPIKRVQTLLSTKTTTSREGSTAVTRNEIYSYDSYNQLSETVTRSSRNEEIKELYRYPYDFPADVIATSMVAENNISVIMDFEKRLNGASVLQQRMDYKLIDEEVGLIPHKFYGLSQVRTRPNNLVAYRVEADFQLYDEDKLLQVTATDGVVTTFIWGYDREYVVAKIVGATHTQAIALVNMTVLNSPPNDSELRTELNKLRTGLPSAFVTTYTHRPGVGMTSVTDPNGKTTYFEYDEKYRLMIERDKDQNVKAYRFYNYFNH